MSLEYDCALLAEKVVRAAGGVVTFDQYDTLMKDEHFFSPFHWFAGWGLSYEEKRLNDEKLCAFAAVKAGLLVPVAGGYALTYGI